MATAARIVKASFLPVEQVGATIGMGAASLLAYKKLQMYLSCFYQKGLNMEAGKINAELVTCLPKNNSNIPKFISEPNN